MSAGSADKVMDGPTKGPHSGEHEDFMGNVGDGDSPSVDLTPVSHLSMRNVFRSNPAEYLKVKPVKLSRKMSKKGQGFEKERNSQKIGVQA